MKDTSDAQIHKLHDWLRLHVGSHQMPAKWYVLDDMPRTSRGKINRIQVAAKCAGLGPVDLRRVLSGPSQDPSE
jgi:acyl-coenzyme A synthetase/AMP-(fatty) acid ligase